MSRTMNGVRVVPLLATRDPQSLLSFFSKTLDVEAQIEMGLTHSKVAYSFTIQDSEGNPYWIHAETCYLDQLRHEY